ncbi:MAG: FG-GAP-like repeat-containing protein, partial [Bacteroidota bacterium]
MKMEVSVCATTSVEVIMELLPGLHSRRRSVALAVAWVLAAVPLFGQGADPWEARAADVAEGFLRSANVPVPGGEPSPSPESVTKYSFSGAGPGRWFGYSISSAGDFDGDGFPDAIVGAPGSWSAQGRVHLLFGRGFLPPESGGEIPAFGSAQVGTSVAGLGDVNSDGYDDIIAGSPTGGLGGSGYALVLFGGAERDTAVDLLLNGTAAGENFGTSVACGGDLNGDGHNDIIVGAPYGGTNFAGRVYVYFGGLYLDAVCDTILEGEADGDYFGSTVAFAGDVDDDGYSDFLVGAPYHDDVGALAQGRAYLYRGGTFPNMGPFRVWDGWGAGALFGSGVAPAGDLNDGGQADILIGANGCARVFFGEDGWDAAYDLQFTGHPPGGANFGRRAVAGAFDFNADGVSDVVVGDYGSMSKGTAYVFYGSRSVDELADQIFNGEETSDMFGAAVAGIGDMDSDGSDEIMVGAYWNDGNGADAGRAHLFAGTASGPDIADATFEGEETGDLFGYSVADAGDFNCDGYRDVIVGAPFAHVGGVADAGKAYVYYGGPAFATRAHLTLSGLATNDNFGWSVAGAGDVNGDGCSDVVVGAPFYDAPFANSGAAFLFLGGASPGATPHRIVQGEEANDWFGYAVAIAGDLNQDGYGDVAVGAPEYGTARGRVYVYRGANALPSPWTAHATYDGSADNLTFGASVAGAGDVNCDGYDDLLAGESGSVRVYLGAPSMVGASPVVLSDPLGGLNHFGSAVAGAGNLDGDAYDDIVVGSPSSASNTGRAYIYRGGSPLSAVPWRTLVGEAANSRFGCSVASAGDVNGDHHDDLIVGARVWDDPNPPRSNVGRAYVYFGRSNMRTMPDIVMTGEAAGDEFGCSVAGVGDFNGDGLDDVLVGVAFNDKGSGTKLADAGSASLFLSSSPAVTPNISSVRDVPGDQGGRVTVSWKRS